MSGHLRHRYLLALGSNVRHTRHGRPRDVLHAAVAALRRARLEVLANSSVLLSDPVGPSLRRYANAACLVATDLDPEELLRVLKRIEREFGRRVSGQRWRARVLDLDIVLWSGGAFASRRLVVPHPLFRNRAFVLGPTAEIAPGWRDPLSGLTIRQLLARLTARRWLPRSAAGRALSSVGRATDF